MNYWSRENTKDWIHNVENRLEDFDYYLKRAVEWCENNGVWEDKRILMCCLVTCIWVSSMRDETVSFQEIVELVGLDGFEESLADKVYDTCKEFQHLEHEEILEILISKTQDWGNY
jgi:hypothetical protein